MSKKILQFIFVLSFFFALTNFASAEKCENAKINVIARDQYGKFIPNINFAVYTQVVDVDNQPKPGVKVASGKTDPILGKGVASFAPSVKEGEEQTSIDYALKLWDKNEKLGEFWFYDQIDLTCGEEIEVTNILGGLRLSFYDTDGDLVKNIKGSLYTQRFDLENKPIKEKQDLIGAFDTSLEGESFFYLGGKEFDIDNNSTGLYMAEFAGLSGSVFKKYDITVTTERTSQINYVFSEARFSLKDLESNEIMPKYKLEIYKQDYDSLNNNKLGLKIKDVITNSEGVAIFEYPEEILALAAKNSNGEYQYFWQKIITDQRRSDYDLYLSSKIESVDQKPNGATQTPKPSLTKKPEPIKPLERIPVVGVGKVNIVLLDSANQPTAGKVNVYKLLNTSGNNYKRDAKSKTLSLTKATDFDLTSGPYLFVQSSQWGEYGQALYVESGKNYSLRLKISSTMAIKKDQIFTMIAPPASQEYTVGGVSSKLLGKILLQVESKGEAYYIHPDNGQKYYLKNGETAYTMMRNFGLGITNNDLAKISVGVDTRFNDSDADSDGLADSLEFALGTQAYQKDSDGDGYNDGAEIKSNYNPLGSGNIKIDSKIVDRLKGRIILQVQSKGEAWYLNPADGKRYYMGNGSQAYDVMRFLSLGVKNSVLEGVKEGKL